MIVQLSIRQFPLAGVLGADTRFGSLLRDLDVVLVLPFVRTKLGELEDERWSMDLDLEPSLLERIRHRRAYVVIDHSTEGHAHRPLFSEAVHAWCTTIGIAPSSVIYVNQNRAMAGQYADWCDEHGVKDRYRNLYFDAWLHRTAEAVRMLDWPAVESELLHRRRREHRFLNFNNAPRPERILVASHLLAASPPDALVSLGHQKSTIHGTVAAEDASLRRIEEKYRRASLAGAQPDLLGDIDVADLRSRTTLPSPTGIDKAAIPLRFDIEHYADSYVSVVTETEMNTGANVRVTEKSIKPLLLGHIALVAGNPGAISILRGMGFETFAPFIDESYDTITQPAERLAAVLAEVDRLRAMGADELHDRFVELDDIRRSNLRHGRDVLAYRLAEGLVAAVTGFIIDDRAPRAADA